MSQNIPTVNSILSCEVCRQLMSAILLSGKVGAIREAAQGEAMAQASDCSELHGLLAFIVTNTPELRSKLQDDQLQPSEIRKRRANTGLPPLVLPRLTADEEDSADDMLSLEPPSPAAAEAGGDTAHMLSTSFRKLAHNQPMMTGLFAYEAHGGPMLPSNDLLMEERLDMIRQTHGGDIHREMEKSWVEARHFQQQTMDGFKLMFGERMPAAEEVAQAVAFGEGQVEHQIRATEKAGLTRLYEDTVKLLRASQELVGLQRMERSLVRTRNLGNGKQ